VVKNISHDGDGRNKAKMADEMKRILQDQSLCIVFEEYLTSNHCVENLHFWIEVELFKRNSPSDQIKSANEIWEKFLEDGASDEVNLDSQIKSMMRSKLVSNEIDVQIFSPAQDLVWDLMINDSLPKFLESRMYQNWKESSFNAMLKDFGPQKKKTFQSFQSLKIPRLLKRKKKASGSPERGSPSGSPPTETLYLEKYFAIKTKSFDRTTCTL